MPTPVLTYHAMRVHGNSPADNDIRGLEEDLRVLGRLGVRTRPLAEFVEEWLANPTFVSSQPTVALTCDDGSDLDFRRIEHPTFGLQPSILSVLREAAGPSHPHITSFVIVSPDARKELDRTCMIGKGWWGDDWWKEATASGYMHIGNHSWDHNHDALPMKFARGVERGQFHAITTFDLAEYQIAQAQQYLATTAPNPGTALFAYPYGHCNEYLEREYFPRRADALGLRAAFGDAPRPITESSSRWNLPRYVRGRDWKSGEELEALLRDAGLR